MVVGIPIVDWVQQGTGGMSWTDRILALLALLFATLYVLKRR